MARKIILCTITPQLESPLAIYSLRASQNKFPHLSLNFSKERPKNDQCFTSIFIQKKKYMVHFSQSIDTPKKNVVQISHGIVPRLTKRFFFAISVCKTDFVSASKTISWPKKTDMINKRNINYRYRTSRK